MHQSLSYHPNPFGSVMQGRNWTDVNRRYRYGFNGKEKDFETANDNYDFGARIYDGRLGRWLSLDPLKGFLPNINPYNFAANIPILFYDVNGEFMQCGNAYSAKELQLVLDKVFGNCIFSVSSGGVVEFNRKAFNNAKKNNWSAGQKKMAMKMKEMIQSTLYTHNVFIFQNPGWINIELTERVITGYDSKDKELSTDVDYKIEMNLVATHVLADIQDKDFKYHSVSFIIMNPSELTESDQKKEGVVQFDIFATVMHELLDHAYYYQKSKGKALGLSNSKKDFVKNYNITAEIVGAPFRTGATHDGELEEGAPPTKIKGTPGSGLHWLETEQTDFTN